MSLSAGEQQHPAVSVTVRPDHTDITCIITCISCVNFHSKVGDAGLMVAHVAHAPGVSQVTTLSVLIGGGLHLLAIFLGADNTKHTRTFTVV